MKRTCPLRSCMVLRPRAGDGARTRDIQLGRLTLYQLSYSRVTRLLQSPHGGGRIRTFEGVSRQIYSLLPLATWVPHLKICIAFFRGGYSRRPHTQELTARVQLATA